MKFLITLLFSFTCFAQVAYFPVGKPNANMNYAEAGKCQEMEGQECYNVALCPLAYCDLQTVITQDPDTGINIEKKTLVEDSAKKASHFANEAAKLAAEAAKEAKKKVAKDKLKALKKSDMAAATTIVKLKDIVQILIDAELGELQE